MTEYLIVEKNEEIKGDKKTVYENLSKYSRILSKESNIYIHFPNDSFIKLKSNKSYIKICSLNLLYPEENILFTSYPEKKSKIEITDNGISKLKETINEKIISENEPINIPPLETNFNPTKLRNRPGKPSKSSMDMLSQDGNDNSIEIRGRKDPSFHFNNTVNSYCPRDSLTVDEEEDDSVYSDSVILVDEVKSVVQEQLYHEGSHVAYNHELFKALWKNLYKLLLIFPFLILIGLFFYMKSISFKICLPEGICYLLVIMCSYTAFSGSKKMIIKKPVNFKKENYLILCIILMSIYVLIAAYIPVIGNLAFLFLNEHFFILVVVFCCLIVLCVALAYLNRQMINFYNRYYKKIERGLLLIDVK